MQFAVQSVLLFQVLPICNSLPAVLSSYSILYQEFMIMVINWVLILTISCLEHISFLHHEHDLRCLHPPSVPCMQAHCVLIVFRPFSPKCWWNDFFTLEFKVWQANEIAWAAVICQQQPFMDGISERSQIRDNNSWCNNKGLCNYYLLWRCVIQLFSYFPVDDSWCWN